MLNFDDYFRLLRDWLSLGAALALPMLALGHVVHSRQLGLFGPVRQRAVPWSGTDVIGAFALSFLSFAVLFALLCDKEVLFRIYGEQVRLEGTVRLRCGLWSTAVAWPFQMGGILLLLHWRTQAQPYQVGLTTSRLVPNILVGFLSWLVVTPVILLLHAVTQLFYQQWTFFRPEPHGIQKLILDSPTPFDWMLTVLTASLVAPCLEELIYRGVLQQWLTRQVQRGDIVTGTSLLIALLFRGTGIEKALREGDQARLVWELQPMFFAATMVPIYLGIRFCQRTPAPGAICASSLLFAIWHAEFWPSPIPLFPLGAVLGWLAYRTQSLVPAIVVHMLFNGVAILGLTHQDARLPGPPKGSAVTSAVIRPADVSASTFVPGTSEPRRR